MHVEERCSRTRRNNGLSMMKKSRGGKNEELRRRPGQGSEKALKHPQAKKA